MERLEIQIRRVKSGAATTLMLLFVSAQALALPGGATINSDSLKPNILIILADDMGVDDFGSINPQLATPRLDGLAKESLAFKQFYVNAVCAPTRASLLTGRHFLRTGVSHVHGGKDFVHKNETLLPQALKINGYATGIWGKWHSGHSPGYYPWERGFDEAYMADLYKHEQSRGLLNGRAVTHTGWADEVVADYAIDFMQRHRDTAFFAFLSFLSPHTPIRAPEPYVAKHLAAGRSPNQAALYGMIEHLDHQIGRVLDALEELGLAGNTIVLFLSDNGPQVLTGFLTLKERQERYAGGLRGHKGDLWENGVKSPLFVRWQGQFGPAKRMQPADVTDLYPTLVELAGGQYPVGQLPLDGSSLLPYLRDDSLRPSKTIFDYVHRGWIPSDDVPYTLDGLYREYDPVQKDTLHWERQVLSVRRGDFKFVLNPPGGGAQALFDIRQDPMEQRDVAAAYPVIAGEMRQMLKQWFTDVRAEEHAFQMPVFQIGGAGYEEYPVFGKAPQRISAGLRNTVTALKYWPAGGGFAEYGLHVAEAGRYRLQAEYESGDCPTPPAMSAFIGEQKLSIQLGDGGQADLGILDLPPGPQRLRIEIQPSVGEAPCTMLLKSLRILRFTPNTPPVPLPAGYVNPFIGTLNMGNTYPGAQAPFGMIVLSPNTVFENHLAQNSYDSRPGYSYAHDRISGFALTRYSGIGCHAMQDLPLMFTTQPLDGSPATDKHRYSSQFHKENESASPGRYEVYFHEDSLRAEATAAVRSGLFRLSNNSRRPLHLILNPNGAANGVTDSYLRFDPERRILSGWARSGGFCERNPELWPYTIYFALQLPVAPEAFGAWDADLPLEAVNEATGKQAAMWLRFSPAFQNLTIAVAISYVSEANALENLTMEIPAGGFDALLAQTQGQWGEALGKVRVEDSDEAAKTAFYTALYHNMLQPSIFQDVNGQYAGFDDAVHLAPEGRDVYANFSLWDTYRTTVQLQAMLFPERVSDMVQSLLLYSRQSHGGMPVWTLNNTDNGVMNGYSAYPFIANAYAFGARDFDLKGAVEQMKRAAEEELPIKDGRGWEELALYKKYGYLPADSVARYAVSKAIEYSVADYSLAQLCLALGDSACYRHYFERSKNVFHNLNPETGYFQPRNADGSWHTPFDPKSTFGFNEGNSAQYSFSVPQHIETLIEQSGGAEAAERRLDDFFSQILATGWHIRAPHYWLGNEPCFGVNYLYNRLGKPEKNQAVIDEILPHFGPGPDGLAGNDDAGAMSALFAFKALGLYPYVPGEPVLELSRPLFGRVIVEAGHGTRLVIRKGDAEAGVAPKKIKLNGQPVKGFQLDYNTRIGMQTELTFE